jgi:hypothetical protein
VKVALCRENDFQSRINGLRKFLQQHKLKMGVCLSWKTTILIGKKLSRHRRIKGFYTRAYPQLAINAGGMGFNRPHLAVQARGYFEIALSSTDGLQDLDLARTQRMSFFL